MMELQLRSTALSTAGELINIAVELQKAKTLRQFRELESRLETARDCFFASLESIEEDYTTEANIRKKNNEQHFRR